MDSRVVKRRSAFVQRSVKYGFQPSVSQTRQGDGRNPPIHHSPDGSSTDRNPQWSTKTCIFAFAKKASRARLEPRREEKDSDLDPWVPTGGAQGKALAGLNGAYDVDSPWFSSCRRRTYSIGNLRQLYGGLKQVRGEPGIR